MSESFAHKLLAKVLDQRAKAAKPAAAAFTPDAAAMVERIAKGKPAAKPAASLPLNVQIAQLEAAVGALHAHYDQRSGAADAARAEAAARLDAVAARVSPEGEGVKRCIVHRGSLQEFTSLSKAQREALTKQGARIEVMP